MDKNFLEQINKDKLSLVYQSCPNCFNPTLSLFYSVPAVPINSVLLLKSRDEALSFLKGDVNLAFCENCGFITNISFQKDLIEYSSRYEETQGFSGTFTKFHNRLANYLIDKYDLRGKKIVEIGCGKGEFIALLCEMGQNYGIGIDPTFLPDRKPEIKQGEVEYIADWYSKKYADLDASLYICKMTLEHIPQTNEFLSMVRETIGNRKDAKVFFQVPEVTRILEECAFWDIFYEHCSYFSADSIVNLFHLTGFDVKNVWTGYDDQYLMIEASPLLLGTSNSIGLRSSTIKNLVDNFSKTVNLTINQWVEKINLLRKNGKKIVVWGGSSKTVSFLTTLNIPYSLIEFVVDINPYKNGTYLAGSGQQVVLPEFLQEYQPDIVLLMNPIYQKEVSQNLADLGLNPRLILVNE
ncbi:MAG: SAM-dependent methyltransferase [Anaerolineaceae bacterium]|nr:SAM-dependent methyltransferase [Anaerolineaceae bacterium]